KIHIQVFSTDRPILVDAPGETAAHRIAEPGVMFPRIKLQAAVEIESARVIVDIRPCETAGAVYQYAIEGPAKPTANRAPPIDVVAGMNFEIGTGVRDEGFGKIIIGGGSLNIGNCTQDKRVP